MEKKVGNDVKQEVKQETKKEDFLLSQIDEFREKAKQLQGLLVLKESKVQELQTLVDEKEDQAQELEHILTERREESDRIVVEFDRQVSKMIDMVSDKLDEMESSVSRQVEMVQKAQEEQLDRNKASIEEQITAVKELTNTQNEESKARLEEQSAAVQTLLEDVDKRLAEMKNELTEKVHSENVKCYRNIQDLFKEFGGKLDQMDAIAKNTASVRGYVKCLTWLSGINFVVLVGFILYSLGVFNF